MAKQSERGQESIVDQLKELAVPIDNLHPDPANARKHNDKNLEAIKASLAKFGQRKPIVVQREGMIVRAGNGTLAAAKALGWKHIAAVVLEEDNATASQFAIADNRTAELAEWDNETLASLLDGMDETERESIGFDSDDVDELLSAIEEQVKDQPYTNKITSPIYQITGPCPQLREVFDVTKRNELLREIEKHELPDDVAAFLQAAAERHVVFRYDRIAEFYAHASKEVQALMEQSALVIIDFDQAIENSFVKLAKEAEATMLQDHDDA